MFLAVPHSLGSVFFACDRTAFISVTYGSYSCTILVLYPNQVVCRTARGNGINYQFVVTVGPPGNQWSVTGSDYCTHCGVILQLIYVLFRLVPDCTNNYDD